MKKCTKCGENKKKYFKDKRAKDGLFSSCADCCNEQTRSYRRTKNGLITAIFGSQKYRTKIKNFKKVEYTLEDLKDWIFAQEEFCVLYNNWKASGYTKMLAPSVDRIDDYKGYSLDNIQLVTWQENFDKGHNDRRKGINNKQSRSVMQLSLQGKFICKYPSIREASRQVGANVSHISKCCRGDLHKTGGYKWKYI